MNMATIERIVSTVVAAAAAVQGVLVDQGLESKSVAAVVAAILASILGTYHGTTAVVGKRGEPAVQVIE